MSMGQGVLGASWRFPANSFLLFWENQTRNPASSLETPMSLLFLHSLLGYIVDNDIGIGLSDEGAPWPAVHTVSR